jgi:ubiquinone/menaquinone biosynthesis C-methylase UbiE
MNDAMTTWECQDGIVFLQSVGVRRGDKVLDFGCRVGHYSIPAAFVVGRAGIVYALDKDQRPLDRLIAKAKEAGISNIKTMCTAGRIEIALESGTIDVVLFYDVLHYLTRRERKMLYQEMFRLLRPGGLLSVYPKHTVENTPSQEFRNMRLREVEHEIRISGFEPNGHQEAILSHDDALERGRVLNFRKHRRDVEQFGGEDNVEQ